MCRSEECICAVEEPLDMTPFASRADVVILEARLQDALRQRDELLWAIDEWSEKVMDAPEHAATADDELRDVHKRVSEEAWGDGSA